MTVTTDGDGLPRQHITDRSAGGLAVRRPDDGRDSVPVDPPPRLLAGITGTGRRLNLAAHLSVHGPNPMPPDRDHQWAARFVAEVAAAGLTGRGGAGFPTARKLDLVRTQRRRPVLAVNATEGEPASAKDRTLATWAPHLVLDGAALLARAVGARSIVVCVAGDNHPAARAFEAAIAERRAAGLPGAPVEVRQPPAHYVAGEESALARWLDGGPSLPTFRPQRPTVVRVGGRPTLVDNAETVAQAALIGRHGAGWFRSVGTPEAPGTTLLTVSGAVTRPGVYEVPLGVPLRDVLVGAGATALPAGVLLGGYGGAWLASAQLHTPLAPAPLAAAGSSLGAGVVAALPDGSCGLAETARIAAWMAGESAGQCGPCAFGLPAIAADLGDLAFGRCSRPQADRLWERLYAVEGRGACHHPDGVVRMVRSALQVFGVDVERHLRHGPCAGAQAPTALPFPRLGEPVAWR